LDRLTVIGAGVSGLVAAIEAAEHGWAVDVLEAGTSPGGRARTLSGRYRANTGPHAIYVDGSLWHWLEKRELQPSVVAAKPDATLYRVGGRLGHLAQEIRSSIARVHGDAPDDMAFRDWLLQFMDASCADAVSGLLFVTTYDYDPGRLAAGFMAERLRRGAKTVRYVVGGWARMVDNLTRRAMELGVSIRTRTRISSIGPEPTVVATPLDIARQITADPGLCWPSATTALLDVGLRGDAGVDWFRVYDLDTPIYLARYTAIDPSLAPSGYDLIQIAAAFRPDESPESALGRAESLLDACWPRWRGRVHWQRRAILRRLSGAIDLPGTCWRDRPAVLRSRTLCVATDQSAAPGTLAEVGTAAALQAISLLDACAR
jgi:phytoene dehydrogenase-like protein